MIEGGKTGRWRRRRTGLGWAMNMECPLASANDRIEQHITRFENKRRTHLECCGVFVHTVLGSKSLTPIYFWSDGRIQPRAKAHFGKPSNVSTDLATTPRARWSDLLLAPFQQMDGGATSETC